MIQRLLLQLKLRGQAPKALRWKRLEQRYKAHKQCVNDLLGLLRHHQMNFSCVNRVELDRQHLADIDLMVAVGGDGTVLSAAHFLDHGTIPLLGINSDPNVSTEDRRVTKKKVDERRYVRHVEKSSSEQENVPVRLLCFYGTSVNLINYPNVYLYIWTFRRV
jgi:hypothetical protein